jgi:hypothetical protein
LLCTGGSSQQQIEQKRNNIKCQRKKSKALLVASPTTNQQTKTQANTKNKTEIKPSGCCCAQLSFPTTKRKKRTNTQTTKNGKHPQGYTIVSESVKEAQYQLL